MKELSARYTIRILRNIKEIEEIRPFWEAKQPHPNGDLDLLFNFINSRKEVVCPYVILILLHKKPEAMMVGIVEKKRINTNFVYKKLFGPKLQILKIKPERIYGNSDSIYSKAFVLELIKALKRKETDLVQLENFNIDSHIYKIARRTPGFLSRDYYPEIISHWKTKLPEIMDELFKNIGSKQRHEIFRKERKIQKVYNGKTTFYCYKNENEINELLDEIKKVVVNSFQRTLGYYSINSMEFKIKWSIFARQGQLRGYLLYIEKMPVAFYICQIYKEILYFHYTGYDIRYKNYSPGVVLLKHILEDLYNSDKHIKEIDWGVGDTRFKKHFGNYSFKAGNIYIFPPTIYGLWLNITKSSIVFIKSFVKTILIKLGLIDKITSYWRQRMIKKHFSKNEIIV